MRGHKRIRCANLQNNFHTTFLDHLARTTDTTLKLESNETLAHTRIVCDNKELSSTDVNEEEYSSEERIIFLRSREINEISAPQIGRLYGRRPQQGLDDYSRRPIKSV